MTIRTTSHTSTITRSRVPLTTRNPRRVALKVSADVTFFGTDTGDVGFPWTAADGEFAPDLHPSDTLYVVGAATVYIMEFSQ